MATITYTAKRNISGGRTISNVYAFTLNLTRFDRRPKRQKSTATSLSGRRFTTFHRLEVFRDIQTAPEDTTTILDQTREFLDSVAGGETFDIDGTDYTLEGDYNDSLVELSGFYTFSFKVLES